MIRKHGTHALFDEAEVKMGLFGIFFAIILIVILAYKGWSTIWVAPLAAAVVGLTGGLDLVDMYTNTYMTGFAGFVLEWFPVFMLGAIFGKLMDSTKMAASVAKGISKVLGPKLAVLSVVLAGSILTYGGVSMFVAAFCLYPMCILLFREADIPRVLIPAAITVGVFAYTMVCLPGSPQIQNLIPTKYFGTTATAAPLLGIICGIVMGGGGTLYVMWRAKKLKAAGIEYLAVPCNTCHYFAERFQEEMNGHFINMIEETAIYVPSFSSSSPMVRMNGLLVSNRN